jgi:soluble lytic murein transglycosylase-like protein
VRRNTDAYDHAGYVIMQMTPSLQEFHTRMRRSVPLKVRRAARVARDSLALLGLAVVSLAVMETWRPSPEADSAMAAAPARVEPPVPAARRDDARRRALAGYVARRFRVAQESAEQVIAAAYESGRQVGLDPLLILAVVAVESGFNPVAESVMGARGLMQVIPKHHAVLLREHGGERAMLDPPTNVLLGARILKSYVSHTGSLEAGLQFYNGALWDVSSAYAQKVLEERNRLAERLQGTAQANPQASST